MTSFILDKNKIMLIELHKQPESRIALASTENEDSKELLNGFIPLNVYDLSDNSLVASYDNKIESFDLNSLLPYVDKQFVSIAVDDSNPEATTWIFFSLAKAESVNTDLDTPMLVLQHNPMKCNPEEVEFIDSLLPRYRELVIKQLKP